MLFGPPMATPQLEEHASGREYRGTCDATIKGDRNSFFKCHNLTLEGKDLYLEDCTDCTVKGTITEIKRGDNIRVKGQVKLATDVGVAFDRGSDWSTFKGSMGGVTRNSFGGGGGERERDKDERRAARSGSSGVSITIGSIHAGRSATIAGGKGGRVEVGSVTMGGKKLQGKTVISEDGSVTIDGVPGIGSQSGASRK